MHPIKPLRITQKRHRAWYCALILSCLTLPSDAAQQTAGAAPQRTAQSNDDGAARALIAWSQGLAAINAISYKSHVLANDKNGGVINENYDMDVKLAKPNNMRVDISKDNKLVEQIVIHQGMGFAYDAVKNVYHPITLATSGRESEYNTYAMAVLGYGGQTAIGFAASFMNYRTIGGWMAGSGPTAVSESAATINGKKTILIHQVRKPSQAYTSQYDCYLDADSGVPVRLSQTSTTQGKTEIDYQEDFTSFAADDGSVKDADFSVKPPDGATMDTGLRDLGVKMALPDGATAPNFSLKDGSGKDVLLSTYIGKPVVIYFWSAQGEQLLPGLPDVMKLSKILTPTGVVFMAVGFDADRPMANKFAAAVPNSKVIFAYAPGDSKKSYSIGETRYALEGLPGLYLINKDGTVAASYPGYYPGSSESDLKDQIKLAQKR